MKAHNNSQVVCRPFRPEDQEAVIALLASKRQDQGEYIDYKRRMWDWQYRQNPHTEESDPILWVCQKQDRIVGFLGISANRAVIDGEERLLCWGGDFIVAKDQRRQGIGTILIDVWREHWPLRCGFDLSPDSYAMAKALKWDEIKTIREYMFTFRPAAYNGRELFKWAYGKLGCWSAPSPGRDLEIRVMERELPEGLNPLWQRFEKSLGFAVKRDRAYLQWKYVNHPLLQYTAIAAFAGGRLAGLVICRTQSSASRDWGIIVEVLVPPEDGRILAAVLKAAVTFLRGRGVDAIRCVTTNEAIGRALARLGFYKYSTPPKFVLRHSLDASYDKLYHQPEGWFLTGGDSDNDMLVDL